MDLTILSDFEFPGLADGIARQYAGARLQKFTADVPLPARLPGAALLAGFLDNVGRFARGEALGGVVDREAGY